MSLLVLIPSVHVVLEPDGALRADDKFLTGLRRHVEGWDGPVRVILRAGHGALPFSRRVARADVPGELVLLDPGQQIGADELAGASVVLGSGDSHDQTGLGPVCGAVGARLVYAIEYTLPTRLRTAALDPGRGVAGRAKSAAWVLMEERRRRHAFRNAAALQFNGYPAARAYGELDRKGCFYLDGRMRTATMATDADMARRAEGMRPGGGPLRLTGVIERLSDGAYIGDGPIQGGLPHSFGPTAVLRVDGVRVLDLAGGAGVVDHAHAAAALARLDGAHHAGRAGADNQDVDV